MSTLDTSSDAMRSVGLRAMSAQAKEIFDVVLGCQRNGAHDMSLTEIRDTYERLHGKRIDLNRVSARVYDLVNAGRLVRREDARPCSLSRKNICPVYVPLAQAGLFK